MAGDRVTKDDTQKAIMVGDGGFSHSDFNPFVEELTSKNFI